ncbi:hypothetical protein DEH69_11490 [Streptomyces sp. PT12]|nr:hypothetical protein DEH69_11490 [Streptomyces sp. PT12]
MRGADVVVLDARGLRALAHPVRVQLLGLLRRLGPATATQLATRMGLTSGATSYHLRQLDAAGLVEEDTARGNARDRWWRSVHRMTRFDSRRLAAEEPEAALTYLRSVATSCALRVQQALDELETMPPQWRDVFSIGDMFLRLTPEEARRLTDELRAVVGAYRRDPRPAAAHGGGVAVLAARRPCRGGGRDARPWRPGQGGDGPRGGGTVRRPARTRHRPLGRRRTPRRHDRPAAGGGLVAWLGPLAGLTVNAASFALGSLVIAVTLPAGMGRGAGREEQGPGLLGPVRGGAGVSPARPAAVGGGRDDRHHQPHRRRPQHRAAARVGAGVGQRPSGDRPVGERGRHHRGGGQPDGSGDRAPAEAPPRLLRGLPGDRAALPGARARRLGRRAAGRRGGGVRDRRPGRGLPQPHPGRGHL